MMTRASNRCHGRHKCLPHLGVQSSASGSGKSHADQCADHCVGTPEKVYEATAKLLQAQKPHGAFVLGASNAVQKDVPMQNYGAMIAAWKNVGQHVRS
jgi:hypothetical protein